MKSRTMLCNFYKELSIPVSGEEKNRKKEPLVPVISKTSKN
jgi:hypothetical protein